MGFSIGLKTDLLKTKNVTNNKLHSTFVSDIGLYKRTSPNNSSVISQIINRATDRQAGYDYILAEKLRNMQALSKKLSDSRFIDSNGEPTREIVDKFMRENLRFLLV